MARTRPAKKTRPSRPCISDMCPVHAPRPDAPKAHGYCCETKSIEATSYGEPVGSFRTTLEAEVELDRHIYALLQNNMAPEAELVSAILTDGHGEIAERRSVTREELAELQEQADAATDGGWVWSEECATEPFTPDASCAFCFVGAEHTAEQHATSVAESHWALVDGHPAPETLVVDEMAAALLEATEQGDREQHDALAVSIPPHWVAAVGFAVARMGRALGWGFSPWSYVAGLLLRRKYAGMTDVEIIQRVKEEREAEQVAEYAHRLRAAETDALHQAILAAIPEHLVDAVAYELSEGYIQRLQIARHMAGIMRERCAALRTQQSEREAMWEGRLELAQIEQDRADAVAALALELIEAKTYGDRRAVAQTVPEGLVDEVAWVVAETTGLGEKAQSLIASWVRVQQQRGGGGDGAGVAVLAIPSPRKPRPMAPAYALAG